MLHIFRAIDSFLMGKLCLPHFHQIHRFKSLWIRHAWPKLRNVRASFTLMFLAMLIMLTNFPIRKLVLFDVNSSYRSSLLSLTLSIVYFLLCSFIFPSLKTLGEDLVTVLDFLHVKYVIGLGEGAGANVLARFGLAHAARCLGLILINCTGSAASVVDSFKTKVRKNSTLKKLTSFCLRPYFYRFSFIHRLTHSSLIGKPTKLSDLLKIFFCTINLVM